MKNSLFVLLFLLVSTHVFSQKAENEDADNKHAIAEEGHSAHHKKHAVSVVISHTHIKSGVKNNVGDNWIALPSFGINYNYSFNEKWAIGLHNDIIVEEFVVEDKKQTELQNRSSDEYEIEGIDRSYPIASAVMLTYKPFKHVAFLVGGGMEFSEHENFGLIRLGLEIPFHIPNNWEIFGVTAYDINIDAYNSFTFGLGIAKLF